MKCFYPESSDHFFQSLGSKLGSDFVFLPFSVEQQSRPSHADVILFQLSPDPCLRDESLVSLRNICRCNPDVPTIAFLAWEHRELVHECIRAGAYNYFAVTNTIEQLDATLRHAAQFSELQREARQLRNVQKSVLASMSSASPKFIAVCELASRVANTDATVLISGETGTGKEVLARTIHSVSKRANLPFIAVACSSLPETLIEAELFGHERGAFTGAVSTRKGRFEVAEGGTIFLDEIGDLSPALQLKLLRVLQERAFERLGSNESRPMNARVLCATSRDLKAMVQRGEFRADTFYRVNTITLQIPPLRERYNDVAILAQIMLEKFAKRHGRPASRIRLSAMLALSSYVWPGNVRELEHVIERAVLLSDGPEIGNEHLPLELGGWGIEQTECSFETEVRNFKRHVVGRALAQCSNNKTLAAHALGISRASMHRLITDLELERDSSTCHLLRLPTLKRSA